MSCFSKWGHILTLTASTSTTDRSSRVLSFSMTVYTWCFDRVASCSARLRVRSRVTYGEVAYDELPVAAGTQLLPPSEVATIFDISVQVKGPSGDSLTH
jgi:hypothetical protein